MVKRQSLGKSSLPVLALVALAILGAAIGMHYLQNRSTDEKFENKPPFEKVSLDDIAQVKIVTEKDTVDIKKQSPEVWGLASRGGFPVDADKLRRIAMQVTSLKPVDRLTNNVEKYSKLGVTDDKPESGHVQFLDASGKILAGLYAGSGASSSASSEGGFSPPNGQFVRVEGDPWVYRVQDKLDLDLLPASWLTKDILKVESDKIQEVKVDNSGTTESFDLGHTGTEPFKIATAIPEDFKDKPSIVQSTTHALNNLTLTDVLPLSDPKVHDINFGTTYTAIQKNGLAYHVGAGKVSEDHYIRVVADYVKAADLSLSDVRTSDSVAAKTYELAETTMKKVNDQHGKWVYKVDSYQFGNLTKKLSELIERKVLPTPTPGSGETGPPAPPAAPGAPHVPRPAKVVPHAPKVEAPKMEPPPPPQAPEVPAPAPPPAEKPAEKPADQPADKPADQPAEKPPAENPPPAPEAPAPPAEKPATEAPPAAEAPAPSP